MYTSRLCLGMPSGATKLPLAFLLLLGLSVPDVSVATMDFSSLWNMIRDIHDMMPFHVHVHPLPYSNNADQPSDSPQWCQSCKCGFPNRGTRIVGGRPTLVNEFPWVAALSRNGRLFCGATLINDRFVLTAAHCVQGNAWMIRMNTVAVLAEHNTALLSETTTDTRRIAAVHRHPNFRPERGSFDGDLALLLLASPVRFRAELQPACLPQADENFSGYTGTVAGWGRVSETGIQAAELQAAEVPILDQEECLNETPYRPNKLTEHMLCAGPLSGGTDSCQGDSGGALLVEDVNGRLVTAGVVSWGEGCARPGRPGVYTRVNHYLPWIQQITREACYCS